MSLSVGFDPEIGLLNKKAVVPAWLYTEGSKDKPAPFKYTPAEWGVGLLYDGIALEINCNPVMNVTDTREVTNRWDNIVNTVFEHFAHPRGLTMYNQTLISGLAADIRSDKRAQLYGCSEDFNAFAPDPTKSREYAPPDDGVKCFGGHIHFGYDTSLCPPHVFVKLLTLAGSASLDGPQGHRRNRFGLPGLYRPKKYGVEFRTPSNAWCFNSSKLGGWVGCAMLINDLLHNNKNPLLKLYRDTDWSLVETLVRQEQLKTLSSLQRQFWDELSKHSPKVAETVWGSVLGEPPAGINRRNIRMRPHIPAPVIEENFPDLDEDNA